MKRATAHFTSGSSLMRWALASILVVIVLLFLAGKMVHDAGSQSRSAHSNTDIRIYCAAGIADTIQSVVDQFNQKHDFNARIERIGGSGELAGQIKSELETGIKDRADILISNDDLLLSRAEFSNCFQSSFQLAQQRPVIAVPGDAKQSHRDLLDLIQNSEGRFGVASERASVGALTREIANRHGVLETLEKKKHLDAENVMVLAQALVIGSLDAAVIWDTTVLQINSQRNKEVLKIAGEADTSNLAVSNTVVAIAQLQPERLSRATAFAKYLKTETATEILLNAGYRLARPIEPNVSVKRQNASGMQNKVDAGHASHKGGNE